MSYQFKEIIAACRDQGRQQKLLAGIRDQLERFGELLKFSVILIALLIPTIVVSTLGIMITTPLWIDAQRAPSNLTSDLCLVFLMGTVIGALTLVLQICWEDEKEPSDKSFQGFVYRYIIRFNIFSLGWYSIRVLLKIVVGVSVDIASFISNLIHFAQCVFITVHSDIRTICFVDSVIGATIGYFSGSALVGAVAGALLGVVNYRVVSIRWLKLVPKT